MFNFETRIIKTDIIAVKIIKKYYLVGVGGYLHIFEKKHKQLYKIINVFESQKIYNIIPNVEENKFLIYGGNYIKIITANDDFTHTSESASAVVPDWILTAKWINNHQQVATVSMHNRLQVWNANLELITEIKCEEKCILYSAFICHDNFKDLIILSGTVFSEVLVWKPTEGEDSIVLKRLQKHKGVIFSINYNETSHYLCSSSDDRSTVVWRPKNGNLSVELQQQDIEIEIVCHVFGHLSRIFRCLSLQNCFLTAGEDSFLNIWSYNSELLRKIETHQGGPVWALDASEVDNTVLTGGSDCGATIFPLNCKLEEALLSVPNKDVPKTIGCLNNSNLVVITESGRLYHYLGRTDEWLEVYKYDDLKSYAVLVVSKCRNLVALAGYNGQIYIYKQQNDSLSRIISSQTRTKSRIFALHWINCETFLICESYGNITLYFLKNGYPVPVSKFILPPSKERWSTAAVFVQNHFVIGDRKGNLHLFQFGKIEPVQTLKKVHSHLGVTNLIHEGNKIISIGRNAVLKIFTLHNGSLQLTSTDKLPFTWLVDIIDNMLLAFSADKFILWDYKNKRIIFEKPCGGGHRSWDFLKTETDVKFCYVKDKVVHIVSCNLDNFAPVDLIEGYQVKEINSIKCIKIHNEFMVISGGEDTTLRVNLTDGTRFDNCVSLKPHLSSIRTIVTFKLSDVGSLDKETYLVLSGGGRAQIILWKLEILHDQHTVKDVVCTEQHSYYKSPENEESERRIMDLNLLSSNDKLFLFAACSDGNVKVFLITQNLGKYHLQLYRDIFYKLKCILKLSTIDILSCNILVTMATDGRIVFWDTTDIVNNESNVRSFHSIQCHQSGINSFDFKIINENRCLFLTGGDDNAIVLNLIQFQSSNLPVQDVDIFTDTGTHCAQITGVFLSNKYFVTASIDQRIAIFKWELLNDKILCEYVCKYNTAIADVQGLCCFESNDFDVFIYGKGIEYIQVKKQI